MDIGFRVLVDQELVVPDASASRFTLSGSGEEVVLWVTLSSSSMFGSVGFCVEVTNGTSRLNRKGLPSGCSFFGAMVVVGFWHETR